MSALACAVFDAFKCPWNSFYFLIYELFLLLIEIVSVKMPTAVFFSFPALVLNHVALSLVDDKCN